MAARALIRAGDTMLLRKLRADNPVIEATATVLSEGARAGGCWLACSTALLFAGPRYRRAALDGLAALGLAELAAKAIKQSTDRRRPRLPGRRGPAPSSSSLPSAHTAAAVAYTVAAGSAAPVVAAPLAVLASAVSWSRMSAQRHFPTDVVAGVGVGLAIGGVIAMVRRRLTPNTEDDQSGAL